MKLRYCLLVLLLFIVACAQTQELGEEPSPTACPYICLPGNAGVETTVNHPKDDGTVFVNDRMAPRIKVEDVGEASIEGGFVCLTGLNEEAFQGVSRCDCEAFSIDLDDPDALPYDDVTFSTALVTDEAVGDQDLTVYTRYSYSTFGIFELCISGDPDNEKECDTSSTENRLVVSSAAPVEITSVTQTLTPQGGDAVALRVNIEAEMHTDANQELIPIDDATNDACVLEITYTVPVDVTFVLFEDEHAGACSTLQFRDGEDAAHVTCKFEVDTATLVGKKEWRGYVRLDYGFQEIQSVRFTVTAE